MAEDRQVLGVRAWRHGLAAGTSGSRLLHGIETSWKYGQRVRCSRLPATVAALRIWPEAPFSTALASIG